MNQELLEAIRRNLDGFAGKDLWDVLTALRGPDIRLEHYEDDSVKAATTCVIRYFFFGKPSVDVMYGSLVYPDSERKVETRQRLKKEAESDNIRPACGMHFLSHAQKAFRALGLKWDELNT